MFLSLSNASFSQWTGQPGLLIRHRPDVTELGVCRFRQANLLLHSIFTISYSPEIWVQNRDIKLRLYSMFIMIALCKGYELVFFISDLPNTEIPDP